LAIAHRSIIFLRSSARASVNATGPGLKDQRRFDFVHVLVLPSRDFGKPRPRYDALGPKFLAAPRADDELRRSRYDLLSYDDPVLGSVLVTAVGENIDAAGDLDGALKPTRFPDITGSSHSAALSLASTVASIQNYIDAVAVSFHHLCDQ
jgi:hypothetical protein